MEKNESFIHCVTQSGALIKWLNYWDDLEKAEETIKEAKESVKKARDAVQSTMARHTKLKATRPGHDRKPTQEFGRKGDESKC